MLYFKVLQDIEKRLAELDEEQQELREYQKLDKQRRSVQYAIYSREVSYFLCVWHCHTHCLPQQLAVLERLEAVQKEHDDLTKLVSCLHWRANIV